MKVLYIWDADYPWDIRVDKITGSLANDGHDVHIVCRNLRRNVIECTLNGVHIHRLKYMKSNRFNDIYSIPLPVNPAWLLRIRDVIIKHGIELLIVRDLPLALSAIILGNIFSIDVIFDMAEDYPAMLAGINRVNGSMINNIIRNPKVASYLEEYICKRADAILVVIEESKSRLIGLGIEPRKIELISNTPILELFDDRQTKHKDKEGLQILYIGGIQMVRGIQTVIESLKIIKYRIPDIQFKVIGDGYALSKLKDLARLYEVNQYIDFTGYIPHELLPSHISSSDICIIPHNLNQHTSTTIPNKLFDYMAMGKPVVVSDVPPLMRIVNEQKCGFVFKHKDPVGLAEQIFLLQDKRLRRQLGDNGRKAVETKYNWAEDYKRLKTLVEGLTKR